MTDRELMQQALEALEQSVSTCFDQYSHHKVMSRPEHFMNRAMEALRERLAQPEQPKPKPVAWWDANLGVFDEKHFDQLQPLYTSPPPQREWQGLTDEEILSEAKRFALGLSFPFNGITTPEMFARTIEAKLKEKNT